jgi:hypothetical protein
MTIFEGVAKKVEMRLVFAPCFFLKVNACDEKRKIKG